MSHNDLNSQVVGSVTVNLFFTSKGKADGRIYRADEILQYNEESIREMQERLRGMKLDGEALKELLENQEKFDKQFKK